MKLNKKNIEHWHHGTLVWLSLHVTSHVNHLENTTLMTLDNVKLRVPDSWKRKQLPSSCPPAGQMPFQYISVAFCLACLRPLFSLRPGLMYARCTGLLHDPYPSCWNSWPLFITHSFNVEWSRGCSNMLANTAWTIWNTNKKSFKVAIHCNYNTN